MGADAPMVKNGCTENDTGLSFGGCSCHNDKAARRRAKRGPKREDERQWKTTVEDER